MCNPTKVRSRGHFTPRGCGPCHRLLQTFNHSVVASTLSGLRHPLCWSAVHLLAALERYGQLVIEAVALRNAPSGVS